MRRKWAIIVLCTTSLVWGYIDPGSTGMIIGGSLWPYILAALAAAGALLARFFRPLKRAFKNAWKP